MPSVEKIEMDRYRDELAHDVRHLVDKYTRIMAWDVPELDEARARALLFQALHDVLVQAQADTDV